MKKITIIRHAKSSWEYNVIDHERPLNKRGLSDSLLIGNKLKSLNFSPELVLVSDALRTKLTSDIILSNLNIDKNRVEYSLLLYDFYGRDLIKTIKTCDNSIKDLMLFGHNHAITNFVNTFGNKYVENVPTCGVVVIEFKQLNWKNISNGNTIFTLFPKDLK